MKYGIIGALDEEVRLLKSEMNVKKVANACGCRFYDGDLEGKRVCVVCCSVGKINAAVCATILVREMGCDAVINVGVAGAMGKGLHPLDVVLSKDVVLHDVSPIAAKYYPFTLTFPADPVLLSAAKAVCSDGVNYRVGRIATGDQFVEGGELRSRIEREFAPDAVEMEGGAVAQVCYMNSAPFLIIRTMSDSADEGANESYDNLLERAAQQSARIVKGMLKRL